jgi:hypothetical protein
LIDPISRDMRASESWIIFINASILPSMVSMRPDVSHRVCAFSVPSLTLVGKQSNSWCAAFLHPPISVAQDEIDPPRAFASELCVDLLEIHAQTMRIQMDRDPNSRNRPNRRETCWNLIPNVMYPDLFSRIHMLSSINYLGYKWK